MRFVVSVLTSIALLVVMGSAALAEGVDTRSSGAEPDAGCITFHEVEHAICDEFKEFWTANGGLPVFGFPLTGAIDEENPDTGEILRVQYFERQRLELHLDRPAPYNVLLGRLGVQVLEQMGQDWTAFPAGDPSAPNYFPETGHAVAPEFWSYWSGHGLELGDEGVSLREAVMLFGYPISEPREETNPDGDTVLTQWFERARFEYHPDNAEPYTVLLGRLGAEIERAPAMQVLATGLNNPRGMAIGADGAIYVAEAGNGGDTCVVVDEGPAFGDSELCFGLSGAISRIVDGQLETVVSGLPSYVTGSGQAIGPHGVAVAPDGTLYVTLGLALHPEDRSQLPDQAADFGHLIRIEPDGSWTRVADLAAYELANDPEPEGGIHSNPYAVHWIGDGLAVTDAAGNDLLHVTPDGAVSTLAAFPPQEVEAPPAMGLPPGTIVPMASVPTSVTQGPDGALYVGEFTGFPFTPEASRIWRVAPDAPAEVYRTGLTAVIDVAFDPDGNLYALEAAQGGLGAVDPSDPDSLAGALVRLNPDGGQTVVAGEGLVFPSALLITPEGRILVANFGMVPNMGAIVEIDVDSSPLS